MSREYRSSYTSSFKVKDEKKFKEWVDTINATELIEEDSKEHGSLYKLDFDDFECG
tara:strand:- start:35 stop:202 length:168 start_codon:yes stop_codon:yes gene_type:complete